MDGRGVNDISPASDAALLASGGHDGDAFRQFYDRHVAAIARFASRRVGSDDHAALEVVAETFARAWLGRLRFVEQHHLTALPWLYGIAGNVIRESVRAHHVRTDAIERLGLVLEIDRATVPPGDDWLLGLEDDLENSLDADFHEALLDLSSEQRTAVIRRVIDGDSYDEIAASLDISPGAARVRVSRGLARLRNTLTPLRHQPAVSFTDRLEPR